MVTMSCFTKPKLRTVDGFGNLPLPLNFVHPPKTVLWSTIPPVMKILWQHSISHVGDRGKPGVCTCESTCFIRTGNLKSVITELNSLWEDNGLEVLQEFKWDASRGYSWVLKCAGDLSVHVDMYEQNQLIGLFIYKPNEPEQKDEAPRALPWELGAE